MDRVWEVISWAFGRAIVAGMSAFAVMLAIGWSAMYLEVVPPEPEATRYATYLFFAVAAAVAILGLRAAKAAVLTVPIFLVCAGVVLMWQEWGLVTDQPDLNGDGIFTIRDLFAVAFSVLTATGKWYWEFIFGPLTPQAGFIVFLEVPYWLVSGVIRIALTLFFWFFTIGLIPMVINFEPPSEEND